MTKIGIIVGSTRPSRVTHEVARWVHGLAKTRSDAEYELLDLEDFELPLYDEPVPAAAGQYAHEHTRRWSAAVQPLDGYVFVVPEYNHGPSSAVKNAIDFLFGEWNNKAAGLVSFGVVGGVRAAQQLRLTLAGVQVATVEAQVALPLAVDFPQYPAFEPTERREAELARLFDQVESWSSALATTRSAA